MDIISETWQAVKGFEGFYEVSNLGNVRRGAATSNGTYTGRPLKPWLNTTGYYMVSLFVNNKPKHMYVHRLVAEAFIGDKPEGCQINHLDGNKLNNHPSNLEYVTPKQNTQHALEKGLKPTGSRHGRSKLNEGQVLDILARSQHTKVRDLANEFGVCDSTIIDILKGRTWNYFDRPQINSYLSLTHHKAVKLSPALAAEIRAAATTTPRGELAKRFGVSKPTISDVVNGKTWRHLDPQAVG